MTKNNTWEKKTAFNKMTLCTAYIRQANDTEELIFATDSCLTMGEKWKHGIKLFELPRKDCLLCFAGDTMRAYPLVLNLISSIHLDQHLASPSATLEEVLDFLSELFSKLVRTIDEVGQDRIHEERGSAQFLFGGWDWQKGAFRLWKLYYSSEIEGFIFDELTKQDNRFFYTFLGNASIDVEQEAKQRFKKLLFDEDSFASKLDMEPLRILSSISLDKGIREVDGSLQIAKVYKSNRTEFFGIYWESSQGTPCFQGREYTEITKPRVRYFDPDTFEIIEPEIPLRLHEIDEAKFLDDTEFIQECYNKENIAGEGEETGEFIYHLKNDLKEKHKVRLRIIFKEMTYRSYVREQEDLLDKKQGLS
ncbi:hypothetical protein JMN32_03775 [Fulvivirga sp. 29W222]|uniref:Uncharacterized protein n=1 Tax=Fulvivirga marina TaxID=2494733 RepID=A0A937FW15_9BACT|nr:hypothetical protein [Fulvivirga marina]MBL6445410.1 hypothetical protein [Fulvivirga marina]